MGACLPRPVPNRKGQLIRFGSKLYRQIVGISMGTILCSSCCSFVLFCYERDFMLSLSDNNQADVVEACLILIILILHK